MGDVFKEQLVKRTPSRKDALVKAALIGAGFFISLMVYIFIAQILPVVLTAVVISLYWFFGTMKKEYEYIFTNGDLDIDCIYNKSRRKRMFTGDIRDIILMTHIKNADREAELAAVKAFIDCSGGAAGESTYVFLANYGGKRMKITFEPNEMMLMAMKPYVGKRFRA